MLLRYPKNPILKPDPNHDWENWAVFNGSIIKDNNQYQLIYRAMGKEETLENIKLRRSRIAIATSPNGLDFIDRRILIEPTENWEKYGCEDPRVTKIDNQFFIFYTALSVYPPNYQGIKTAVAISPDLKSITAKHLVTPFNAKAMAIFPEKIEQKYTVILTVNTDQPPTQVALAQFEHLETLWNKDFWRQWYGHLSEHTINLKRIATDQVEVGAVPIKTAQGWLLIYAYIKHYLNPDLKKEFRIEGLLLDFNNPKQIIGRIEKPLLIPEESYEKSGQVENVIFPSGALLENDTLSVYYGAADTNCTVATANWPSLIANFEINSPATLKCQKFSYNPLLQPIAEHPWEAKGVCNPAAVELNRQTYIVYRAISHDNQSNFGLAISKDGLHIDERLERPIYPPRLAEEKPRHSGLGGGVEDPRLTIISDSLYMLYTAFDGQIPRLAISAIKISNFLDRKFDRWTIPKVISPPNTADKDGAIFPEKIYGKYAIFHRIDPNIVIDFVNNLRFAKKEHLDSHLIAYPRNKYWDEAKIGINGPPIKTEKGWLVFYHGISQIDHYYRVGALLLDLKDITKVIARTAYPILEPETSFEKNGLVNNVVFSCGQIIKNNTVYIYYGGADRVVCGAKIDLKQLLDYILKSSNKRYLL